MTDTTNKPPMSYMVLFGTEDARKLDPRFPIPISLHSPDGSKTHYISKAEHATLLEEARKEARAGAFQEAYEELDEVRSRLEWLESHTQGRIYEGVRNVCVIVNAMLEKGKAFAFAFPAKLPAKAEGEVTKEKV